MIETDLRIVSENTRTTGMNGLQRGRAVAAGVAVFMVLTAGCGDTAEGGDEEDASGVLQDAYDECSEDLTGALEEAEEDELDSGDFLALGDDGHTLAVSSPMESTFGAMLSASLMGCVLDATDAPDSVSAEMQQVSALDGRQEAEWDDISLEYSYHADSGFDAVFTTS